MASNEPTTPSAAPVVPKDLSVFNIPDNAEIRDHAAEFSIALPQDSVRVCVRIFYRCEVSCEGTGPALVNAGIVAPDWLVKDRGTWCVAFQNSGPRVVVGGRGHPKGRYMKLMTRNGEKYRVRWYECGQQREEYERRIEELQKRSREPEQATDSRQKADEVERPEERARRTARLADAMLDQLRGLAMVEHKGLTLSVESQQRILRDLAVLRRAFAEARVMATAPKCAQIENIICWPGRGRIAQVAPAELF